MDKDKSLSMAVYGGAAISALMVIISMFFSYAVAKVGTYHRSGFAVLSSSSGFNIILIVLSLVFSICVLAISVLRLLGMLDGKMLGYVLAVSAVALLIISVILMIAIVKTEWKDQIYDYKRGIGMILNLVFSILAAMFGLGCLMVKKPY